MLRVQILMFVRFEFKSCLGFLTMWLWAIYFIGESSHLFKLYYLMCDMGTTKVPTQKTSLFLWSSDKMLDIKSLVQCLTLDKYLFLNCNLNAWTLVILSFIQDTEKCWKMCEGEEAKWSGVFQNNLVIFFLLFYYEEFNTYKIINITYLRYESEY